MKMKAEIKESRSSVVMENLDEMLNAEESAGSALWGSMNQYFTPEWLVKEAAEKLPDQRTINVIDPQCGIGNLVKDMPDWGYARYGVEMDNRIKQAGGLSLVTGNCVKVFENMDELGYAPVWHTFNANPPFAKRWKLRNGKVVDSTQWTWEKAIKHGKQGIFISNEATIKKLGIDQHPFVVDYSVKENVWKQCDVVIGVVVWRNQNAVITHPHEIKKLWDELGKIADEEKQDRPPWNIWMSKQGKLETYLSTKSRIKFKLQHEDILRLHKVSGSHPIALTVEKETRKLLRELVDCGVYTVEPAALKAIDDALAQVNALACPIMPVTPFEMTAYADELDQLECVCSNGMDFTPGKFYELSTATYSFTEKFTRDKVHYDEANRQTYTSKHDCTLSGQDRYIQVKDDQGIHRRFMDKPRPNSPNEHDESLIWQIFRKPDVKTIADVEPKTVELNKRMLKTCEMLAGYKYYPGQVEFLSRVAVKDYGLIGASVGTGKTLMAISLIAIKAPERALIIAPQGTMRSSKGDEEDDEQDFNASQWVMELRKFCPYLQVFELFSMDDYHRIRKVNNNTLPPGVYVTYFEAFLRNKALESAPDTWDDEKLSEVLDSPMPKDPEGDPCWCVKSIGEERNGIRCIISPSMGTLIGHHFDCIMVDEAHYCFPFNEKVMTTEGQLPIGKIVEEQLNVLVYSVNLNTGKVEWKPILKHLKFENNSNLVKITHEHGTLTCTSDHKIWTQNGYVRAESLVEGDCLSLLQGDFSNSEERENNKAILLKEMRPKAHLFASGSHREASGQGQTNYQALPELQQGDHVQIERKKREQCHEILQPHMLEHSSIGSQWDGLEKGEWLLNRNTNKINSSIRRWMGDGVTNSHVSNCEPHPEPSDKLQGGCGQQRSDDCHRNRWPEPSSKSNHSEGRKEIAGIEPSRVVSVEVLESRNNIERGGGCAEGSRVYCLEVEGNNNFFVGEVLVSNCKGMDTITSQMLVRLQPKYRYALTATPIHNVILDLFPLMGWLCVPDWYKGDRRNAAWPYAREELSRFEGTFMSKERDFTEEAERAKANPMWRGKCEKSSPIISSPARLLKILKPTLSFISKEACNPAYKPAKLVDVRVPMGLEQARLYGHFLNRGNIKCGNPLIRARKQIAYLRAACADPAGFTHGGPPVRSNFNPKTIAILELIAEIVSRGEQVVVLASRVGQTNEIARRLTDAGISFSRIDSTVSPGQQSAESNKFKRKKTMVHLMGIKCAVGHSYPECPNLIVGSLEYSFGSLEQGRGRVDRVNSKSQATIYCILHKDTIEEMMFDRVATKGDAAAICLRGQRVPRDFKPVEMGEILAASMATFSVKSGLDETQCEVSWPGIRSKLINSKAENLIANM